MLAGLGGAHPERATDADVPESGFCGEKNRLMREFLDAIREMTTIQSLQTQAVIDGDPDFARFDVLYHDAQERKQVAKDAWIAHVESHHCEKA